MILSKEELIKYLEQATQLEASIYKQEAAIMQANKQLSSQTPRLETVSKEIVYEPKKPEEVKKTLGKIDYIVAYTVGIILAIGAIALIVSGRYILCVLLLTCCVYCFSYATGWKRAYDNQCYAEYMYRENMRKYEKDYEEYMHKCQVVEINYQAQKLRAQEKYHSDNKNHAIATSAVNKLNSPLAESKKTLSKLYSFDVIYPKYRNLVAISTFYEYFSSGRVTELEGPNGAYNLFENELRMNLIVSRLDIIISQLEEIKANQYTLYNELKDTKRIISGIQSDVSELVRTAHNIEDATTITAYCAKVTAQNTEALKYIALVNG